MGVMVPSIQNQQSLLIGGFSPLSLTGLIGWWDANVAASMTLGGASVVTAMADQSGFGNTMSGGSGPTYNATGFNTSKPAIVFAGAQFLSKSAFALGTGNTLTSWYVGCAPVAPFTGYGRVLSYVQTGGGNDFDQVGSFCINAQSSNTSQINITRNSINTNQGGMAVYPAGHRVIFTISSGGVMQSYIDGVAGTPATSAGNWVSAGGLSIGFGTGPAYWGGPIAEVGIATGFTNSTDVASLDTYLKNKWGL